MKQDLTGKRFGRLVVIEDAGLDKHSHRVWKCKCDCGNIHYATTSDLNKRKTNSCGCYKKEIVTKKNTTHNLTNTKLYRIYHHIMERCYKQNDKSYEYYGARGIKVCDEWLEDFMNFYNWAMTNGYNDNLSIDRIDVNGDYEPSNCRWVTKKVQSSNRRNNIIVSYEGERITLKEYARRTNQKYTTVYQRYKRKMQ